MVSSQRDNAHVPEGLNFLELVWGQENSCEEETDKRIPKMGVKAPACLKHIGTVLSFLDRMASCWWVCRGGDHLIEYLCGRVASNARAALRLLRFGFYDESLLVCRAIGETSNLLQLFVMNEKALEAWKTSSRKERMNKFSPIKVRCELEGLQASAIINENRYTRLCEKAAHVHPETKPQSHNILGVPIAGASLQDSGILVCLNEVALPLSASTSFGVILLCLDNDIQKMIFSAARSLMEQIGGATITEIDDYYRKVQENPVAREELAHIADSLRWYQRESRG